MLESGFNCLQTSKAGIPETEDFFIFHSGFPEIEEQ